jgi:hypothetical protein
MCLLVQMKRKASSEPDCPQKRAKPEPKRVVWFPFAQDDLPNPVPAFSQHESVELVVALFTADLTSESFNPLLSLGLDQLSKINSIELCAPDWILICENQQPKTPTQPQPLPADSKDEDDVPKVLTSFGQIVTTLKITQCDNSSFKEVCTLLAPIFPSVRNLSLAFVIEDDTPDTKLLSVVDQWPTLRAVNLEHNRISTSAIITLFRCSDEFSRLEHLNLSEAINNVDDDVIARCLVSHKKLVSLDLSRCYVGPKTLGAVAGLTLKPWKEQPFKEDLKKLRQLVRCSSRDCSRPSTWSEFVDGFQTLELEHNKEQTGLLALWLCNSKLESRPHDYRNNQSVLDQLVPGGRLQSSLLFIDFMGVNLKEPDVSAISYLRNLTGLGLCRTGLAALDEKLWWKSVYTPFADVLDPLKRLGSLLSLWLDENYKLHARQIYLTLARHMSSRCTIFVPNPGSIFYTSFNGHRGHEPNDRNLTILDSYEAHFNRCR